MTDGQWDEFATSLTKRSTETLARLKTSAATDATPAATSAPRPVVLLMPGWWVPAAATTVLAQELASHGHVVITIGSPAGSEQIDGGDYAHVVARGQARLTAVRATLRILADQTLTELVGPIDAKRVAVGGNSLGGSVGYAASIGEPSVVAVFDLDGSLEILPDMKPVTVPALMVVTLSGEPFGEGSQTVQLLSDSEAVVNVGIRRAAHCDLNDLEIVLLATETSPSDFPTGAECFGKIGIAGPTTTAVIVRRFLDAALRTPGTLPTGESLIDGQPDGVLDPLGLGR
jgi:dienelactone hydrolase